MNRKKSKIIMGLVVLALILSAYSLGYHRGYASRGPVVHFERDTADTLAQGPMKTEFEPYFTKANPIPREVR